MPEVYLTRLMSFSHKLLLLNPTQWVLLRHGKIKHIYDSELSLTDYDLFRKDRPVDREGGGVMLCVNGDLQVVEYVPGSDFPE